MLRKLIGWGLDNPLIVLLLAGALAGYGIYAFLNRSFLFTDKAKTAFYAEKAEGDVTFQNVFDATKATKSAAPHLPGDAAMAEATFAKGQEYVVGFEYQALDNERHPDAKRGTSHQSGALYDIFSPAKDATRPVGEFNHSRLVVKGDHIEHWLNGEKVVDGSLKAPEIAAGVEKRWGKDSPVYNLLVNQPRKECQISLQNHGDEAWFKNIRIRRL